ncbi:MAG TPA: sigma-54 dependent transcriptional regulator [Chloroflexota bacterium]|nr:sigma-54 dependent transcriptional regulator [Chloroflexota bacterium]
MTGTTDSSAPDASVLVADDDASIRSLLRTVFEEEGYDVHDVAAGREVLPAINKVRPDLVMMDVRMPGLSGIEVLEQMKRSNIDVPVLLMTAFGTSNVAIRAIQLGAYDYVTKPFDLDDLIITVKRTLDHRDLAKRVKALDETPRDPLDNIIGNSAAMQDVYKTIGRVARTDATILIHGESGTGKELVATALHANSHRRSMAFVKVACASLTETLLESELFGHEQGAFTSASRTRKGRFEMADKGTIFLDEIGEMSLNTQKKLLRVLQEREFERVGSSTPIKVDTRVIAATNRDLQREVADERFREDLYYRLNVISMRIPPLRERMDDIPLLVEHFLQKYRSDAPSGAPRISEEAQAKLLDYTWPGNVRELENVVHRSIILARDEVVTPHHIVFTGAFGRMDSHVDGGIPEMVAKAVPLRRIVADTEKQAIESALALCNGNRSQAAKTLGIYRRLLYAKMREYGLEPAERSPREAEVA